MIFNLKYLFNKKTNIKFCEDIIKNKNGTTKALFYDGEEYNDKKTKVFAYLGIPITKMPKDGFPAVVLVHGGGGCAFFEWVEYWNGKGYVAIAPDFNGRQFGTHKLDGNPGVGIVQDNPNCGPKGYGSFNNKAEDYKNSWFFHSVCNIVFAHNILLNMKEVNFKKTVLTGISWGGVLTCIASGVDYRFRAFAPIYGGGYIFMSPGFVEEIKKISINNITQWIRCYDPINYVGRCDKPVLFTMGMDDKAFSPLNNRNTANIFRGKVFYSQRGELPHYHRWKDEEGMNVICSFFDSVLFNKKLPYEIVSSKVINRKLIVKVKRKENIKKATFWFTNSENLDTTQWVWKSVETNINNGLTYFSSEVPFGTKACFMEFSNCIKPEIILSSEIIFL